MSACLLCRSTNTNSFYEDNRHAFYKCAQCHTVYRNPRNFITSEAEKERYLTHKNDVNDPAYQNFVSPIVTEVCNEYPKNTKGLDFGAGTGPVIAKLLSEKGYHITLYDPFFHPDTGQLSGVYDFIVCCEVIEHFHRPMEEFRHIKNLLQPGGKVYCMTDPLVDGVEFSKWYYKDDPTHVLFYSEKNLKWIKEVIGFSEVIVNGRLVIFTN